MKVILYTVDPAGDGRQYLDAVYKYAEEMNRLYRLFQITCEVTEYPGKLSRDRENRYQVKKMQNAVLPSIHNSDACFVIFLCRVTEISRAELDQLMENLNRQKKTAFQAWFINDKGLDQVFGGISQLMAKVNAQTPFAPEEREQMEAAEAALLRQAKANASENRLKEAELLLNHAVMIRRKLILGDSRKYLPGLPGPLRELGAVLFRMGRARDAETVYNQAILAANRLSGEGNESLALEAAGSRNNLGILQVSQERYADAEKNYREASAIYEKEMAAAKERGDEERVLLLRRGMADTNANLAVMYSRMNRLEDALGRYEAALGDMREVLEKQPDEQVKFRLLTAANSQGVLYNSRGEFDRAVSVLKEAENAAEELSVARPEQYEPRLAQVQFNLFHALRAKRDTEGARECWNKASELSQKHRESSDICRRLCEAMDREREAAANRQTEAAENAEQKARELLAAGNVQEAAKAFKDAADIYHSIPGGISQVKSAGMFHEIAEMLWDRDQLDQAEICFKNEVILTKTAAEGDEAFYPDAAMALFRMGRFLDEARGQEDNEYLKEALEIAGKYRAGSELAQEVYENLTDGAVDFGEEKEE